MRSGMSMVSLADYESGRASKCSEVPPVYPPTSLVHSASFKKQLIFVEKYDTDYKNVLNMIMLFYGPIGPMHIVPVILLAPNFKICAIFLAALILDLLAQYTSEADPADLHLLKS
jgi:hypothetical protein